MIALTTNKFKLELISESHYLDLKKFVFEEKLWEFSTIQISTENEFRDYFNQAIQFSEQTSQRVFIVYDIKNKMYVGMTRLYGIDSKNKSAKIGFTWYALASQGSGINTHVKYMMLQFAFDQIGLERIELNADLRNKRSIAAMIKIGFQQEGILRKHTYLPNGHKRDTIVFSMLKEEWESTYKSQLEQKIIEL